MRDEEKDRQRERKRRPLINYEGGVESYTTAEIGHLRHREIEREGEGERKRERERERVCVRV